MRSSRASIFGRTARLLAPTILLSMTGPKAAEAYEARVALNELFRQASPDNLCPQEFDAFKCFHVEMGRSTFYEQDGVRYSIAFNIGIDQGDLDAQVLLLRVVFESADGGCGGLRVLYDYQMESIVVQRQVYVPTQESSCAHAQFYSIADRLTPSLIDGDESAYHLRLNLFVTATFLWFEVEDRTNPAFTPIYSSPAYFGSAGMAGEFEFAKVGISATSADSSDIDGGWPLRLSGNDTSFTISSFSASELISNLNDGYSRAPDAPLREFPRAASAVIPTVLFGNN